jgi:predicted PurR-regulated permease PerM
VRGVSEETPETLPKAAPPSAEERKLTDSEPERPIVPPRVVIARWVQLVLLPIALLALWELAKAAGKVLVIFIVAAVIALILNPAVAFLQRARLPRGLAVLTVYLAFFLMLSGIGVLLANPISNQVEAFSHNVPHLGRQANKTLGDLQETLNNNGVHFKFIKQGETALQTIQDKLVKGASTIVSHAGGVLTEIASASFDLLLVFVLSVYMLLYGERIGRLIRKYMPDGDGSPADDYPTLVQSALARYVGGQLLFSLVMGVTAGVALYLLGVLGVFPDGRKYAVVFAVFYGLAELVPYIGPIVGALPAVLMALFTDPITALWVAITFVALQQLEGHVVAPQIFGHTLRINPLLVIFALLLGLQLHGVIGALIALPILSVLRETAVYLSRHITFEPWDRQQPPGLL